MFYDHNPHRDQLHVTYTLIGIGFLLFLWCVIDPHYFTAFLESDSYYRDFRTGTRAFSRAWNRSLAAMTPEGRAVATQFFNLFLYTLGLWIFSDNIEYVMGRRRYSVFIVAMFILTLYVPMIVHHTSTHPYIAMSGLVSAIMGAYARIFPHYKIQIDERRDPPYLYGWWHRNVAWPAWRVVLCFFFFSIMATWILPYAPNTIVYLQQLVGLVMGWLCAPLFRDPDVLLTDQSEIPGAQHDRTEAEEGTEPAVPPQLTPKQRHWRFLRRGAKDPTDGIRPYGQTPLTMEKIDPNEGSE